VAAARLPRRVGAVVSRGGRPDLAGGALDQVHAPTLLIVGGADFGVIDLNEHAMARLRGPKSLQIIPHASHLFPEPGAAALEPVYEAIVRVRPDLPPAMTFLGFCQAPWTLAKSTIKRCCSRRRAAPNHGSPIFAVQPCSAVYRSTAHICGVTCFDSACEVMFGTTEPPLPAGVVRQMPVVMGRQKRHLEPSLGRVFGANEKPEAKCADRERRDPGCNADGGASHRWRPTAAFLALQDRAASQVTMRRAGGKPHARLAPPRNRR